MKHLRKSCEFIQQIDVLLVFITQMVYIYVGVLNVNNKYIRSIQRKACSLKKSFVRHKTQSSHPFLTQDGQRVIKSCTRKKSQQTNFIGTMI